MIRSTQISPVAMLLLVLPATAALAAPSEKILFSFPGTGTFADGAVPVGGLVRGPDGALYGTTTEGGEANCNCGTVFKLTPPPGNTAWTETVIYSFQGYPADGSDPYGNLVFDKAGNLYGTTLLGGAASSGTVFRLRPPTTTETSWTETVLHSFGGSPADGKYPYSDLLIDMSDNLYGTASLGGGANQGIVFKLAPPAVADAGWTLSVLHDFQGGSDGGQPYSGVIADRQGNLYGTTSSDGTTGIRGGTVFRLAFGASGPTETVLHTFTGPDTGPPFDGGLPYGDLTLDAAGNIYGTTEIGGAGQVVLGDPLRAGTVFKLTRPPAGKTTWTETLIHSFNGRTGDPSTTDGATPRGGLVFDAAGNLYGTTEEGGSQGNGTLFKLTPPAAGKMKWTQTILHSFTLFPDGVGPRGNLVRDASGNLFGVTESGTTSKTSEEAGTVYEVTP
jgi:uncharacterized repeat protein (TIGR03803 family)